MDVVFGWLFVSIFLSKAIQIESSFEIAVGQFSVIRKQLPQLRQCVPKALQKRVYVGARKSNQTGECEGLPHSWARNKTIESGYGYDKIFHLRINYEPPLVVTEGDAATLFIPGDLNTGAKIDLHVTNDFDRSMMIIDLFETLTDNQTGASILVSCASHKCSAVEYDKLGNVVGNEDSDAFNPPLQGGITSIDWKISFLAERNTLNILVDDDVVKTKNLSFVRLDYLKRVVLDTNSHSPDLRLHSFEFTEA